MRSLGETIRQLRQEQALPLRTVAANIDIDQAILSKIERGQRSANRELIVKLANFFKVNENDLLVSWLSDKLVHAVADEAVGLKALQVAEEKVRYHTSMPQGISKLIDNIKEVLNTDGRVATAWLYGSIITQEARPNSDVDIMIELNDHKKYSIFDLVDIAHSIEQKINRKVDLVEKGQLHSFALETATQNLQKIYG